MTAGLENFDCQDKLPEASYPVATVNSYLTRYALIVTVTITISRSCIEFMHALVNASYHVGTILNRLQVETRSVAWVVREVR